MLLRIFEKYLIDDHYLEAAYEGLSAHTKGWIKKTLALCRNYYRPDLPAAFSSVAVKIEETLLTASQQPCHSVVILYPSAYAACTRAVAAITPAFFAGVENVIAVAVEREEGVNNSFKHNVGFKNAAQGAGYGLPLSFNLLAALELAGVEDVAFLPQKDLGKVLTKIAKASESESVRILVLGSPAWLNELFVLSKSHNLKIWHEVTPEHIQVQDGLKAETQVLNNLHPDSKIKPVQNPDPSACFLVGDDDFRLEAAQPVLAFGPEYAGCWIWPDLSLDFFCAQTVDVGQ